MSMAEELGRQMREALKAGRKERLRVLRLLHTELQVAATSGRPYEEADVARAFAKSLRKGAEEYDGLGRADRAEALRGDAAVVEEFLPQQLSAQELEALIGAIIEAQELGPRDVGKVMKALMAEHGGAVDGRLAQEIARRKLAEQS